MSKHLLLGDTANNWVLAVTEDPAEVLSRLDHAATERTTATVRVHVSDQIGETDLHVNPHRLPWWTVAHVPDPDE